VVGIWLQRRVTVIQVQAMFDRLGCINGRRIFA
jgi:hypothetical protein